MRLWRRVDAKYLVVRAERNFQRGGDCSAGMITTCEEFEEFTDFAAQYVPYLPEGWKIMWSSMLVSKSTTAECISKVYIMIFCDPARSQRPSIPATNCTH